MAHLWTAILSRLYIICEVLICPAAVAEVNNLALRSREALLQGKRDGFLLCRNLSIRRSVHTHLCTSQQTSQTDEGNLTWLQQQTCVISTASQSHATASCVVNCCRTPAHSVTLPSCFCLHTMSRSHQERAVAAACLAAISDSALPSSARKENKKE